MDGVLTQEEIDALLKSMTNQEDVATINVTETNNKHIKKYDFANPSKFGKEQLRTLEIIFDTYARLISSYLSGYLRTHTQVEIVGAEQFKYSEFTNSLTNPVILAIVDFEPLKGSILMQLTASIGYCIIDRILGGKGGTLQKLRDFSEIEKILLERIIYQLLGFLKEPWENVINLSPKLDKIETNSQFAQIIPPTEMIALVTLNIKIGEVEGFINICIPYLVIEPIMEKLNTKYWFGSREQNDSNEYRENIERRLDHVQVPIKAILGHTYITVSEFISLQQGDVIKIDSFVNSDLNVQVGNLLKFHAKPGIMKGKNAIQITSIVKKEDDN